MQPYAVALVDEQCAAGLCLGYDGERFLKIHVRQVWLEAQGAIVDGGMVLASVM